MGKMLKKIKIALVCATFALFSVGSVAFAAPVTLEGKYMVRNLTTGQIDYTASTNAKPGDIVRYMIWYHNTQNENSGLNALDLRVVAGLSNAEGTTHTSNATVAGSNTNSVSGTVTVNTAENTTLDFVAGSVYRVHNTGTNAAPVWTTDNITNEVVNGSGFVVATMQPCWNFQESVTFDVKVVEVPTPTPTPTPKPTPPVTPPTNPLPTSGPAEAAAGAAGLTAAGGASYAWLKSKKALLSALKKIK